MSRISLFVGKFESPYSGNIDTVSGYAIHRALLSNNIIKHDDKSIEKVSHGIFHHYAENIRQSYWESYDGKLFDISYIYENKIKVSDDLRINDKSKTYKGFMESRNYYIPFGEGCKPKDHPYINPNFSIIRGVLNKKRDYNINFYQPTYLSFFIISDNDICIDEIRLGHKRNDGYGKLKIMDKVHFDISDMNIPFDGRIKETALNGIKGIGTNQKYGFGEFKIDVNKRTGKYYIEFLTPFCLNNSNLPSFIKEDCFRSIDCIITHNGKPETLRCIDRGQIFEMVI
jgi:hypothetical protein